MHRRPLIIGHRGASALAPENTFAAFDLALALGADGIETDIRSTRDGFLVLVHDTTLDRTTNGAGPVGARSWAAIRALDAGSWFGPAFTSERVPRLEELLDRYLEQAILCLEVKEWRAGVMLVRLLRKRGLAAHPNIRLVCFSWLGSRVLHAALSELRVGYLTSSIDRRRIARAATADLRVILPRARPLNAALIAEAHRRRLEVWAWDVPTPADAHRLGDLGVDAMILDDPSWSPHTAMPADTSRSA